MREKITNLPPLPTVDYIRACAMNGYSVKVHMPQDEVESFRDKMIKNGFAWRQTSKYTLDDSAKFMKNLAGLEVDGYAHLVAICTISFYYDGQTYIGYVEFIRPYLLIGDKVYWINANSCDKPGTTFSFCLPSETSLYGKLSYRNEWSWKEPVPQKVGKGNRKKLQAWVDWLEAREKSVEAFLDNAGKIDYEFMERIKASGIQYVRSGKTVYLYNGPFKLEVTISDKEIYSNRIEADLYNYFKDRKMSYDKIDFMLNAKINIEL